ncbi:MAG: hypothetical protein AAB646_03155 [Patescibacteria group bacterium]
MSNGKPLTMGAYLELLKKEPNLIKTAHARIYDAVMKQGVKKVFAEYYGIDRTIQEIVNYFRASALGGELSRKFLFLLGPPGSAKSSLVRTLAWVINDEPIYFIDGCPVRDSPVYLLPRKQRLDLINSLGVYLPEGDICPVCRNRLRIVHNFNWNNFSVRLGHISIKASRGFASVDPTDPMSFDKAKLIGSVTLGEKEGDPEHFELDGAFCRANGGILEMVEIFKNPTEVLYPLLEATQSRTIESPAGRTEKLFIDVAIISHSNLAEWKKFSNEKRNEPFLDRLHLIEVPHNILLNEQIKIIEKISIAKPKSRLVEYHVCPLGLRTLSAFTASTRMKQSQIGVSNLQKVLVYSGNLNLAPDITAEKLMKEFSEDGDGWCGISNRDAAKILEMALAKQPLDRPICVDPPSIFQSIESFIDSNRGLTLVEKDLYRALLEEVRAWFGKEAGKDFSKLAEDCREECEEVYRKYLNAIQSIIDLKAIEDDFLKELVNNVEMMLKADTGGDKYQKRLNILSTASTFDLAPTFLKQGVYWHVNQTIIRPYVVKFLNEEEATDNETLQWYERIRSKLRLFGYCEICIRSVGNWLRLKPENYYPQFTN